MGSASYHGGGLFRCLDSFLREVRMMADEKKEKTKRCKNCDKEISAKAKKCPFCQSDLRSFFQRHPILTVLGIFILFVIVLGGSSTKDGSEQNGSGTPGPTKQTVFNASVNFTGSKFIIGNLDSFDCVNAKMEVNGGFLKGGYVLDGYTLEKNKTYEVGSLQFTKDDGTRLNPWSTKPKTFSIYCRGSNELNLAGWYGEFE